MSIARGEDTIPILVLSLETRSGAQLHFHLSNELAGATGELLTRFSEPADIDIEASRGVKKATDEA